MIKIKCLHVSNYSHKYTCGTYHKRVMSTLKLTDILVSGQVSMIDNMSFILSVRVVSTSILDQI